MRRAANTWDLHYIAPQFLAWFYPANSELLHAVGMNAFGRDLLSPLLNLGWFVGCLLACWCIGRPYRVAPWSLALGAIALSVPALADQAGEARNDIVGIFFLLAAVAIALNAWAGESAADEDGGGRPAPSPRCRSARWSSSVWRPASPPGPSSTSCSRPRSSSSAWSRSRRAAGGSRRWRSAALAALAGGGYWYLRNLVHTGNPLPWFDGLGPISLPAPDQALGGREAHSVLGYLTDGTVWSDWFLPGLHHGLGILWPLLAASPPLAGLAPCPAGRLARPCAGASPALAGLAAAARLARRPDLRLRPGGDAARLRVGPALPGPALVLGLALLAHRPDSSRAGSGT